MATQMRSRLIEFIEARSELADPHELARQFVVELDEDERVGMLVEVLPAAIKRAFVDLRGEAVQTVRSGGRAGSSRWDAAFEAQASGRLAQWRVMAGGVQKPLLDCSADDLTAAVDYHAEKSLKELERARLYARLRDRLDPGQVVGDLPFADIVEAINRADG